jgi:hypothetical protein
MARKITIELALQLGSVRLEFDLCERDEICRGTDFFSMA